MKKGKVNPSAFRSLSQVSKTLKATLAALLENMCDGDCNPSPDVPSSLSHEPPGGTAAPKLTLAKRRANQQETETYYFTVSLCSCIKNILKDISTFVFCMCVAATINKLECYTISVAVVLNAYSIICHKRLLI